MDLLVQENWWQR